MRGACLKRKVLIAGVAPLSPTAACAWVVVCFILHIKMNIIDMDIDIDIDMVVLE